MNPDPNHPPAPDLARIDDAVLALLWLTAVTEPAGTEFAQTSAWKGHDWDALGRLHAKGLIGDPVGKQKSILLTAEGAARARALFESLFCSLPEGRGKPRHRFTPPAARLWEKVPDWAKTKILQNVWCGHCRASRTMEEFTGAKDNGDMTHRGFCAECGHVVIRVLELSEVSGNG